MAHDPKDPRKTSAKAAVAPETVSAPTPSGTPTPEQRMENIENAMKRARPLAENLTHQLERIYKHSSKIGVDKIGGLGGFRLAVELTALKDTLNRLEELFS